MIGQAQVIIGAQIDHFSAVGETHDRALRRTDDAFAFQEAGRVEGFRVARKPFAKFLQHGVLQYRVGLFIEVL